MNFKGVNVSRVRSTSRQAASPKYSENNKRRRNSSIKIEERLINQQVTYKRRLESLKKSYEQEELKEVQSKPKISDKSRVLAQKAEQRMIKQYNYIKNPYHEIEKSVQVQPDSTRSISGGKANNSLLFATPPVEKEEKVRTKSLLNLSVLERNQTWLKEKQSKIGMRKKEIEEKDLVECTFSPKTHSKVRHSKSFRENKIDSSFVSSPGTGDVSDGNVSRQFGFGYKPIAPYQVRVAFKCGIDLNSFMRRAK